MPDIFCQKYQRLLPALERAPMPGATGAQIQQNYSRQAWEQWLQLQTTLINEKQLRLSDPATRSYLNEQRQKFLNNEEHDTAAGLQPLESE